MISLETGFFAAIALAGAIFLTPAAHAADLYTAPLSFHNSFGTEMECKVTNVASTDTTVRVRTIDTSGGVSNDSGNVVLAPLESFEITPNVLSGRYYCHFDVSGGKKRVRAGACTVGGGAGCNAVVPAS